MSPLPQRDGAALAMASEASFRSLRCRRKARAARMALQQHTQITTPIKAKMGRDDPMDRSPSGTSVPTPRLTQSSSAKGLDSAVPDSSPESFSGMPGGGSAMSTFTETPPPLAGTTSSTTMLRGSTKTGVGPDWVCRKRLMEALTLSGVSSLHELKKETGV